MSVVDQSAVEGGEGGGELVEQLTDGGAGELNLAAASEGGVDTDAEHRYCEAGELGAELAQRAAGVGVVGLRVRSRLPRSLMDLRTLACSVAQLTAPPGLASRFVVLRRLDAALARTIEREERTRLARHVGMGAIGQASGPGR